MHAFVICNEQAAENEYLKRISKEKIARISEEMWRIEGQLTVEEFLELLRQQTNIDVAYMDVTRPFSVDAAEQFRRKNREAALLVIADGSISPMTYLKPGVQATSLLLRPYEKAQAVQVVNEIWDWYAEEQEEEGFRLSGMEEEVLLPYSQIAYFESREKRIYVECRQKKYCFYETLGNLEEQLPKHFMRCHRSFIVNQKKIRNVALARQEVFLEGDICIPFSRTYKTAMKEWLNNHEK